MKEVFTRISTTVADYSGHPIAIIIVPIVCILWFTLTGHADILTLVLSVAAITLSQMVLQSQAQETALNKLQMAELLKAIPGAHNELARTDKPTEKEVEKLKEEYDKT